jgi:hypothetical protein
MDKGFLTLGEKRQEREADHSLPSNAKVKNEWGYTSTTQYIVIVWCSIKAATTLTEVSTS